MLRRTDEDHGAELVTESFGKRETDGDARLAHSSQKVDMSKKDE